MNFLEALMRNHRLQFLIFWVLLGACAPKKNTEPPQTQSHTLMATPTPLCEPAVLNGITRIFDATKADWNNALLSEDQQKQSAITALDACYELKANHPNLACLRDNGQGGQELVSLQTFSTACVNAQSRLSVIGLNHLLESEHQIPSYFPLPKDTPVAAAGNLEQIPPPAPEPRYRKTIKSNTENFEILVRDPRRFLDLILDRRKFVIEGTVYDSRTVDQDNTGLRYRNRCTGLSSEQRFSFDDELIKKPLTITTISDKNESFPGGVRRVLAITFKELGTALICVKANPYTDFEWRDIQDILGHVIEVRPKTKTRPVPSSPAPKFESLTENGHCQPGLVRDYEELRRSLQTYAERLPVWAAREAYATDKLHRDAYHRLILESASHLVGQCQAFEMNWRDFDCRYFTENGIATPITSQDFDKACAGVRAEAS
jgi:hypothetical protein